MSKALIIAEKPSVASDIARALGGFTKKDDYFESENYVLSSAVGHLVEIGAPEEFEVKRGKWSFTNLPVLPPRFDLKPIAKSESRLKLLTKLIKRKDVTELINACDAGREGELIFRLIAQHAGAKQPVRRLWLQSMTPAAIRDGFEHLRSDAHMMPLADAARCRSEADWLVGINGTRAMTAFNSKEGGFFLTTVGRVQTPTLAIVVERDEKIRRFVPRDYFEVHANFDVKAGQYAGRWFDPQFKRDETDPEKRPERLWQRAEADAIVAACQGQTGVVTEETKPSSQIAPALYDLTSLQREANSRFGFSAKTTLSIAQALYEKHKVLTYPRTDSRALPEDYLPTVLQTLGTVQGQTPYETFAGTILKNHWVKPNKRIFDNSKVSDHFAIIPTLMSPKNLSEVEAKLYDMVVRRFLAVFYPAAEFLVTTRITKVLTHAFKTDGKVLVNPGWMTVYGRDATGDDSLLVAVSANESARTSEIQVKGLVTRPPARYTEATLLSAMESAGKNVSDEDLREAMAGKGLGTPATRAATIEGLITEKYLLREGRELSATAKAFQLMTLLRGLGVNELTLPELTGEWEHKLSQIEHGELNRTAFMRDIAGMTQAIVERAKNYSSDTVPGDYASLETPCPKCGGQVKENYRRFACTQCDFSISKTPASRQFELPEIETLLRERQIGPLPGFRSKMGRAFSASLKLTPEFKMEFDFGDKQQDDGGDGEPIDFSDQTSLGTCPKCQGKVYEHGASYACEHHINPPKSCDFRSGKVILQQAVSREQMEKLLNDGKTDLLPGFVSSRTNRKFKAFLVRGANGAVGFEFEPRAAKAPKTLKAEAPAEADAAAASDSTETVAKAAPAKTTKTPRAKKTSTASKAS